MRMPAVALLLLGLSCRPAAGPSPGAAAARHGSRRVLASAMLVPRRLGGQGGRGGLPPGGGADGGRPRTSGGGPSRAAVSCASLTRTVSAWQRSRNASHRAWRRKTGPCPAPSSTPSSATPTCATPTSWPSSTSCSTCAPTSRSCRRRRTATRCSRASTRTATRWRRFSPATTGRSSALRPLGTRGMVLRRESWDAYIAALARSGRRVDPPRARLASEGVSNVRGGPRDDAAETSVLGFPGVGSCSSSTTVRTRATPTASGRCSSATACPPSSSPSARRSAIRADGTLRPTRASSATKRLLASGDMVANHSYSHALLPKRRPQARTRDRLRVAFSTGGVGTRDAVPAALRRTQREGAGGPARARHEVGPVERGLRDWADPVPRSIASRVIRVAEQQGRGVVLFHDIHAARRGAAAGDRDAAGARLPLRRLGTKGERHRPAAPLPWPRRRQPHATVRAGRSWSASTPTPQLAEAVAMPPTMRARSSELLVSRYQLQAGERRPAARRGSDARGDPRRARRRPRGRDPGLARGPRLGLLRRPRRDAQSAERPQPGYIVPVDADLPNFQSQAISMTNFQDVSEAIPAKHVLFVMDACYSGLALTRGAAAGRPRLPRRGHAPQRAADAHGRRRRPGSGGQRPQRPLGLHLDAAAGAGGEAPT